ncbi:MAG: hypothetical protein ABWZ15_04475 [Acidimicrobiia bacterium]
MDGTKSRNSQAARVARDISVGALGLLIGLAGFAILRDDGSDGLRVDERRSVERLELAPDVAAAPEDVARTAPDPAAVATTARAAVDAFFAAEQRDDFAASFNQLSSDDQEHYGSPAAWEQAHRDIPEVTGYAITGVEETAGGAEVNVDLSLRAGLDEVVGLTPGRATAAVSSIAQSGGWRVQFAASTLTPRYADERGARDAVVAWARDRQACTDVAAREWSGGLLGVAAEARAAALCETDGEIRATDPATLDAALGVEPVLAAFGPEASVWARVVTVQAPLHLDVVTAPVGDEWIVIGVADSASAGP